jgi:hypothetical protein
MTEERKNPPRELRGTVVVLGAGASRAAGSDWDRRHAQSQRLACLPPLNADFFTHLQRITSRKYGTVVRDVMKDVVDLFGSNFRLTLEDYFTQLEFLLGAVKLAGRSPELLGTGLSERRDHLMAGLGAVLESSTMEVIGSETGCPFHQKLVGMLGPSDTIISFNYDCLIDDALRRFGDGKWHPKWGYGFPSQYELKGLESWTPKTPAASRRASLRLLKLHGSVNWQLPPRPRDAIRLKTRLYKQRGTPKFSIIPPVWNKAAYADTQEAIVYPHIWRASARAIRMAARVVVIGFSFASTDLQAQSVFRIALDANKSLRLIVLATPSAETRRRIREVFDVPLAEQNAIVRQFSDFEDLVNHMEAALA